MKSFTVSAPHIPLLQLKEMEKAMKHIRIALATRNPRKLDELQAMLRQAGIKGVNFLTLADVDPNNKIPEPEETGTTFKENAQLKAREYARALNMICLGEDSGLIVDDLPDVAGVQSNRWFTGSDTDRNNELLRRLNDVTDPARTGRYVCSLALATPDGTIIHNNEGECGVRITLEPRGEQGFAYDPITAPCGGNGDTFGQMPQMKKAEYSHRGRALRAFLEALPKLQLAS